MTIGSIRRLAVIIAERCGWLTWVRGDIVEEYLGTSSVAKEVPAPHFDRRDLLTFALLACMVALLCIAGVKQTASAVNTVFSSICTTLA